MNYSNELIFSIKQMQENATPNTTSQINELLSIVSGIRPKSPFYPQNANMIELINVNALGLTGNASIFLDRNENDQIKGFSIKFTSTKTVNRQIKNDIYELTVTECPFSILRYIKPEKPLTIGFVSHYTSGRAGRNLSLISRYTSFIKKDNKEGTVFYSTSIPGENDSRKSTDENNDEGSAE